MMERGFLDVKTIREIIRSRGSKKLITVEKQHSVSEAVELMKRYDIEQIPVMEDDLPVGAISQQGLFTKIFADPDLKNSTIQAVMEKGFPIVPFDSPAEKLTQYISKENGAVLTRDEAGSYHIITKYDVIAALGNP
jgi:cystathionine beta-synthase